MVQPSVTSARAELLRRAEGTPRARRSADHLTRCGDDTPHRAGTPVPGP